MFVIFFFFEKKDIAFIGYICKHKAYFNDLNKVEIADAIKVLEFCAFM